MDKRTKKYIINITLIIVLSVLVIYFSMKDDFSSVVGLLAKAKMQWIVVCIGIAILYHFTVGYILREFAKLYNKDYRYKDGLVNAFIAALFHGLTPFSSGGQFVQAYVFYKQKVKVSDSASILLMDFIVYQSTLVVYTFILILARVNHIAGSKSLVFKLAFFGFMINFIVIIGLLLLAKSRKAHEFITHQGIAFMAKLKLIKHPEEKAKKINEDVMKFRTELTRLGNYKKLMFKVILANIVRLTLYNSIPYVACLALGVTLNFEGFIDIVALSSFVGMVNAFIPLPGASGGTEGTYIVMFQSIFSSLPKSIGVGSMLIWRFASFHLILLIGLVVFIVFKRKQSIKKIEEEIYENRLV